MIRFGFRLLTRAATFASFVLLIPKSPKAANFIVSPPVCSVKVAVIVLSLFIVIVAGLMNPVRSPDQLLNCQPLNGIAVNCTFSLLLYVVLSGFLVTEPEPTIFIINVRGSEGEL